MKIEFLTLVRKEDESNSHFLIRMAHELQKMTSKILDVEINLERGYISIMFVGKD